SDWRTTNTPGLLYSSLRRKFPVVWLKVPCETPGSSSVKCRRWFLHQALLVVSFVSDINRRTQCHGLPGKIAIIRNSLVIIREYQRFLEEALTTQSILWRGIHWPGHEACRLFLQNAEWHLEGTAVFSHVHQPCRLSYLVVCEETWNTLRARISGWVGDRTGDIDLVVDPQHRWRLNGIEHPTVAGCIDLDLNFSPSTH